MRIKNEVGLPPMAVAVKDGSVLPSRQRRLSDGKRCGMEGRRMRAFFTLCVTVIMAGCAGVGIGGDHIRWTEEVKLSDGKVIQIQRHVELTESGFPAQRKGFYRYHEICYRPMGIHWKSKTGYQPDIFDIVDGRAYIHVSISDCEKCRLHGFPKTNALYFVWESGQWKRIEHEDFPEASHWNLTLSSASNSRSIQEANYFLPWAGKLLQFEDSLYLEQQRIGWKRVSDSYYWRDSCTKCGRANPSPEQAPEIFFDDRSNTCYP